MDSRTASLRGRLSRWLALQTMLGLGLVCAAVYVVIAVTLSQRQDETLVQKQAAVEHLLSEGRGAHDLAGVRHLLKDFLAGHDELSLRLVNGDGQLIFETSGRQPRLSDSKRKVFDIRLPPDAGGSAHAVLVLDKRTDEALLDRLAWTLALAALAGALAVSAGGFLLVRLGLAPLHKLVEQTRQVTATDLERRLDGSGQANELQPLIGQFNALLDRIGAAYRQMEAFNADVAHELNTPLATLISSCELALRKPRSTEELCEAMGSNLEDLHRLASIVGDMLFLSNADRGVPARRAWTPSLGALAVEVLEFHEAALLDAGLKAEVLGDAAAEVDARLLRRALSNLLGNATRYASTSSAVLVHIESHSPGEVSIAVHNAGPTIEDEHLPKLFDRFYRADPSRTHADRNHGLGLAIVAAIARMHGGRAFAESAAGVTRIGLVFPRGDGPNRTA
ncbi:heavy metal sensor histidine kinase [Paucibacter sp. O1-1]|uniref:heavy metal sensor histidine kinase n=1 Tax=Paucibacter sp. M5-1 TaxID=3015998 RepID=UPI0010F8044E|nr:heavy metal sensor histidine kinase [Paucibacter sp. M5-1]MCU7371262.1 heavy metal sensor histidine kinase [Paucibacter sp. O1-1]MCZ7883126.1 heavy metal sensor histidine kinase [Paucibacter sp. M5-1]MDA3826251.1 heavy metal sensor histidine kinase [Paucibacter sp. O1-1]